MFAWAEACTLAPQQPTRQAGLLLKLMKNRLPKILALNDNYDLCVLLHSVSLILISETINLQLRDMLSSASSRGGTCALFHEIILTTMPFLLFSANASASDGKQGGGEHATHHTVIIGLQTSVPGGCGT